MKILVHTRFYPNLGGIETVAWLLAREWHRLGEEVLIATDIPLPPSGPPDFPFSVVYQPNPIRWLRLIAWADVFVHMNISLKALWPLLMIRRPFVAVNHAYYHSDRSGYRDWRERLKLRIMRKATNIAVSQAVAERLPEECVVIPNPVDVGAFQSAQPSSRTRELVFLGRLVSDKGCDLLLNALASLAQRRIFPFLTIIGDGPERPKLEDLVTSLKLSTQVLFTGAPTSAVVANTLRQHDIMVVPSVWEESFGVVALEGAAAGCVILGSDGGGLPEAIGPAGMTFRRGDAKDLAEKLHWLLEDPSRQESFRAAAPAHLAEHRPDRVAARYLKVLWHAAGMTHASN